MKNIVTVVAATICLCLISSCKKGETQSPALVVIDKAQEAESNGNINFFGFYVGMSQADARTLVSYYELLDGEFAMKGDPVYELSFSLSGIRRITKGGNTKQQLFQAVANRIGDFSSGPDGRFFCHSTIDGVTARLDNNGGGYAFEMYDRTGNIRRLSDLKQFRSLDRAAVLSGIVSKMLPIPGRNYRMGQTEVTQAEWFTVMGETSLRVMTSPDHPIYCVSWEECQLFLKKLNALPEAKQSGLTFRLPTAEEWEYACRAGATGDYCKLANGTEITKSTVGQVAWFLDNAGWRIHPVGQKEPNAFGLYDMLGNAEEWTNDADGERRITRGGLCRSALCKSSTQDSFSPSTREGYELGFRLCASGRAD